MKKEVMSVKHLICRIMKSKDHMSAHQTCHILKMIASYFKNINFLSTDTPFGTYRKVDVEIANSTLGPPEY